MSGRRAARELTAIVERRGKPGLIVSDHGTEFTCNAMLAWCKDTAIDWHFIAPGKPMQNGFVESFMYRRPRGCKRFRQHFDVGRVRSCIRPFGATDTMVDDLTTPQALATDHASFFINRMEVKSEVRNVQPNSRDVHLD